MRKLAPGSKKRQERKRVASYTANPPDVVIRTGQDAEDAFLALLARMEQNPQNFVFLDSDLDGY
jgi:hypothetical protein